MSQPEIVTLEQAKAHLGIGHSEQDALITQLLASAIDACVRFVGEAPDPVPANLTTAVLQTVAAYFDGRDGAGIPDETQALLWDIRPWVFE